MKGGFGNLLKQAQQMQEDFKRVQEDLANVEITGESGGGMVKVIMTGRHDVRRVTLDPALLKEEKEMLEDLLAAAVNDANRRVEQASQDKLAGLTAGMGLPPGFKLPM